MSKGITIEQFIRELPSFDPENFSNFNSQHKPRGCKRISLFLNTTYDQPSIAIKYAPEPVDSEFDLKKQEKYAEKERAKKREEANKGKKEEKADQSKNEKQVDKDEQEKKGEQAEPLKKDEQREQTEEGDDFLEVLEEDSNDETLRNSPDIAEEAPIP